MIAADLGETMVLDRTAVRESHAPLQLRVDSVDPSRDWHWERYLARHPNATVYHHPLWLHVLDEAFGYQPEHLLCEDGHGRVRGILPLLRISGILSRQRFSSLPRSPIGGPLTTDREAAVALLRAAVERVRAERGTQLQLKVQCDTPGTLVHELVGGPFRPTYTLPLPLMGHEIRFGDAKHRHRIKANVAKAARLGVHVREAESVGELKAWYQIYLETMRRRFVPPRPLRFFKCAWSALHPVGILHLLLAEQRTAAGTRLLAGGLFLGYNGTLSYAFQGSREDALDLRPNDALQWHAILDAQRSGFRAYDLGEVSQGNTSLATYKEKWGAEPHWLYRYYHGCARERELELIDSTSGWRQLASAAWQHMPLAGTELVSSWLHRHA